MPRYNSSSFLDLSQRAVNVANFKPLAVETTDDARINRAISQAVALGVGSVYAPQASYQVGAVAISIPSNIEFFGDGIFKTVFNVVASCTTHIFTNKNAGTGNDSGIRMHDFTINGNKATATGALEAMAFHNVSSSDWERISIHDTQMTSFSAQGDSPGVANNNRINKMFIQNPGTGTQTADALQLGWSDYVVENCFLSGASDSGIGQLYGTSTNHYNGKIQNNTFDGCGTGVAFGPLTFDTVTINGNTFRNCHQSVWLQNITTIKFYGNTVELPTNTNSGNVRFDDCVDFSVFGNKIYGYYSALFLNSTTITAGQFTANPLQKNGKIFGNEFYGSLGTYNTIGVEVANYPNGYTDNIEIFGNDFLNCNVGTSLEPWSGQTEFKNIRITGNSYTNVNAPLSVSGPTTGNDSVKNLYAEYMDVNGNLIVTKRNSINSQGNMIATTEITPNGDVMNVFAQSAAITLTSTPTIASSYDGARLTLINVGNYAITFQDQGTLAGSGLSLKSGTVAVSPKGSINLIYDAYMGLWVQI